MGAWLVPAIIVTLSGSVIVAAVFVYVYVHERAPGMFRWSLAWVFYSLRIAIDLVEAAAFPGQALMVFSSQLCALVAGLLLLDGSLELIGKRVPRWPSVIGAIVAVWLVYATYTGVARGLLSVPVFVLLGVANIVAGVAWWRSGADAGPWGRVTGASFIIWGLHKFDYPFLRTAAWFAAPGYLLSAIIELAVALGALLAYSERTRTLLARSEQRYAALFEGSSSVMLIVDPVTGDIVDANRAAASYYGWSCEQLRSMSISDINTLSVEEVHAEMADAAAHKRDHFLFRHRHADGTVTDVEVYSGPIVIGDRQLLYSIVHDISRRTAAENALRESEARYASLFRKSRAAMLLVDPDGAAIVDANAAAEALYGHSVTQLKTMRVKDLTSDPQEVIDRDIAAAIQHSMQVETYQHVRADGTSVDVEIHATPIVFEGKILLYTIVNDITERVEAQRALETYRGHLEELVNERTRELTEANRELAAATLAKDEFMTSMSHELRTPLNSVIGFADILRRELPGPLNEEQARQVEMIGRSGHHLLSIVNDILDLARIEAGKVEVRREPLDVAALVARLLEGVAPLARSGGVTLHSSVAEGTSLSTDERLLEQVLWNLLGNAVKFTPDGNVTIRVERISEGIRFEVSDDGIGMSGEQLARAFDKFTRFDTGVEGGTGLGLSISARLADHLGGRLEASSEPGIGSVFTLILPTMSPVHTVVDK